MARSPTGARGHRQYGGTGIAYGGSAGGHGIAQCESPMLDPVTHLVTCSNGFMHCPTAVTCVLPPSAGDTAGAAGDSGAAGETGTSTTPPLPASCTTDADCSSLKLGYCFNPGPGLPPPQCASGCLQDSDCGSQYVCLCDGSAHGGRCTLATCRTDAECGADSLCASGNDVCEAPAAFGCLSAQDECLSDADCFGRGIIAGTPGECDIDTDLGHRYCVYGECGPRRANALREAVSVVQACALN